MEYNKIQCPMCKSINKYLRLKTGMWVCRRCGNVWRYGGFYETKPIS